MEAPIDPTTLATAIAEVAAETKAADIVILDMRGLVDYTDTFILCSGRSSRQVAAIADAVRAHAKVEWSMLPLGVEGTETAKWVLVDFGDAVLHVFEQSMRGFYNLDGLWADAPRIEGPRGEVSEGEESHFYP